MRISGLLSNQGKKYKLLFHKGSFKKKVLKYGTPKPRFGCRPYKQKSLKHYTAALAALLVTAYC